MEYQAFFDDIETLVLEDALAKFSGVNYHPQKVVNPMQILMSAIGENATEEDKTSFPVRFQKMVQTLFENKETVIEIVA